MNTNVLPLAAVVPVFNPEPGLIGLCTSLASHFPYVVVVDDGSREQREDFEKLPDGVKLLRHEVNRGKGRAIKTAIAWVREHCPEAKGVVFADGDGQHLVEDVCRVAQHMLATDAVTLGVRNFEKSEIPFRSRFGNVLTSFLVRLLFHIRIYDTQTGLRAIPSRLFGEMLKTPGERYEYEMHLFGMLRDCHERLEQVPIRTIYIENNRASHFRPIQDSIKVYRGLFGSTIGRFVKFAVSSLIGFATDNVIFTIALFGFHSLGLLRRHDIFLSLVIARVVSAVVNYLCNRSFVFNANKTGRSFGRYAALVVLIMLLSYAGTASLSYLCDAGGILITCIKIVVETVLFVVSYKVQKKWVFAS